MPVDPYERRAVVDAIGRLADKPRLSEAGSWLNPDGNSVKVRVGEIDQSSWSDCIEDWNDDEFAIPFIRSAHFMSIDGEVRLHHPSFEDDVEEGAIQMSQSVWTGRENLPLDRGLHVKQFSIRMMIGDFTGL